jgi:hypothetical protein
MMNISNIDPLTQTFPYESPSIILLEIVNEGVLCSSNGNEGVEEELGHGSFS